MVRTVVEFYVPGYKGKVERRRFAKVVKNRLFRRRGGGR